MAVPRKGSRRIIVEGLPYRWYIRSKPTYSQGVGWSGLTVAVEREDVPQTTRLIINMPVSRPDVWTNDTERGVVLPSDMARYIRAALADGWLADQPGSPWSYDAPAPSSLLD